MITAAIQNDLNWCETLIQNNSSSFYRAFRKLPRQEAQAVFAIYAFCRQVDDIADDGTRPRPVRAAELEDWRRDLAARHRLRRAGC